MPVIKISEFLPQERKMNRVDPSGETWVKIKPPDMEAESLRQNLLTRKRFHFDDQGQIESVEVAVNNGELYAAEIWLTYEDTNGEYDIGGEVVKFEPRSKETRAAFLTKLVKLPPAIVWEWHSKVVDVVRDWQNPF